MSNQNEGTCLDDFLKFEAENQYSREAKTLLSGQDLLIGAVVGEIASIVPTTGTGVGTGNGTCDSVTGGVDVKIGTYLATCITAVTNGGTFRIEDPDGYVLGDAVIPAGAGGAIAFTDPQINLTITEAGTDFIVGDYFTIAVTAGSGKLTVLDFTAVDGSQRALGILIDDYDASLADLDCVVILRDAVIAKSPIKWTMDFTGGGVKVLAVGDTITSKATATTTARVVELNITSGTWAGGDAAGTIVVDRLATDFGAEAIRFTSADTDDATVAATDIVTAYEELKAAGIITREEA